MLSSQKDNVATKILLPMVIAIWNAVGFLCPIIICSVPCRMFRICMDRISCNLCSHSESHQKVQSWQILLHLHLLHSIPTSGTKTNPSLVPLTSSLTPLQKLRQLRRPTQQGGHWLYIHIDRSDESSLNKGVEMLH
jgi:hypothetical protein